MTLNLLIAPDFAPERFGGWHMLNALLQQRSGLRLHLLMPASAHEQAELLAAGQVDLVYANPFDAAELIRQRGFSAFARPVGKADEMLIAAQAGSALRRVEDLRPGCRVAMADHRDVKLIGLRLLEAADLHEPDLQWQLCDSHQAAARRLIKGEADVAFFLAETFHALSRLTRSQLQVVIESALHDITHVMLAHARVAEQVPTLCATLTGVDSSHSSDREVLEALGMPGGFEAMQAEDAEFMVDLMDTLLD
ncbi:phosphate/phosphite/phosphonate ABC transporter substrate-binding protein [Aquabacterium sp. OR-4]|uniref:phosphate/phosphite/phosphonate ABC transporter substrate-binding protein n=1 Tax=Aquabacterium sp. OR-4 TaxID=2978127 RepID=UPI0021B21D87|nr:phosphate/phosphite/phosphonate ABC transporter substrate-binding protein [Aquabacterium sp. OR-4]MDT7837706.1 phosphate/phosphite/phosphonate ABC transporter substrate-binding protein [Aquabacterium sp. OR-4]